MNIPFLFPLKQNNLPDVLWEDKMGTLTWYKLGLLYSYTLDWKTCREVQDLKS